MIPEKIIAMALESVDYSEEKALRILDIVLQEDKDSKKKSDKKKGKDGEGVEKNVSFREPRWATLSALLRIFQKSQNLRKKIPQKYFLSYCFAHLTNIKKKNYPHACTSRLLLPLIQKVDLVQISPLITL